MYKKIYFLVFISILLFSCSERKFNSQIWKTKPEEQILMLNDIKNNGILIGKTKNEIICLLDTLNIKQFNYQDNSWMFIISKPDKVPITKTPIKVMDIEFVNDKVENITIRK